MRLLLLTQALRITFDILFYELINLQLRTFLNKEWKKARLWKYKFQENLSFFVWQWLY